ncbi:MAG: hypothetical protein GX434_12330 [Peptococcaceae bacterium]|nr:hypothetical protein [Peptococcaceae bacterium]
MRDAIEICGYSLARTRGPELLSARELEVLREMSLGITNREMPTSSAYSRLQLKRVC